MSFKKLKKPLLFTTTAFLTLYPICLAEAATTSYALEASSQRPQQTALGTLQHSQPRTSLNRLLLASDTPSIESLQSTLADYKAQLRTLESRVSDPAKLATLRQAIADLEDQLQTAETLRDLYLQAQAQLQATLARYDKANADRLKAQEAYQQATTYQQEISTAYQEAQAREQSAILSLNNARTTLTQATNQYNQATTQLQSATQQATDALTALENARQSALTASSNLEQARDVYGAALQTFNEATSNKTAAGQALDAARTALQSAQHAYDTNLIPDPTWTVPTEEVQHTRLVPHTRQVATTTLVPHTTYITTGGVLAQVYNRNGYNNAPPLPSANETPISTQVVPNINFQWGGGTVLNSNRSEDVIVKFTGNLLFPTDGYYQFYTPADDGTKLTIAGVDLIDDWFDKGGGGSISQQMFIRGGVLYPFTLYYYENGGGAAVSFQYYSLDTPYLQVVPAAYLGNTVQETTTYTEETTYTTETYYTEEVYTTIEPIQFVEKTIQVDINEGGQATFTAPAGATFTNSNLRYEAKDRPECGVNIYPQVNGLNQVTIQASNGVWGDPCGGWYKHVVGTLTYAGAPTAPLIKDPNLLPALQEAQATFNDAESAFTEAESFSSAAEQTFNEANTDLINKQSQYESANDQVTAAEATYNEALSSKQLAATALTAVEATKVEAETITATAETEHATATTQLTETESTFQAASVKVTEAETTLSSATSNEATLKDDAAVAETKATTSLTVLTTQLKTAETTTKKVETEIAAVPEEGSADLPAELSAENLMSVDLTEVNPQELTSEQVTALQEAAYETFLTAEVGSEEYEQALDALYLAAEADDIVLDPALAAIPGLAAATELVNFLGNAGADMSPKVREESKKVVVTAVVAAGAAIQSAAAAASMSSASTRKIGK